MKILLVNANRFSHPPVPPIGLEYLAGTLGGKGHDVRVLDLCFAADMLTLLDRTVREFNPDIAGLTVRNIDSVIFTGNEFYLDELRDIVQHLKSAYDLPVVVGGAGLPADPRGILDHLGADYAISGPGEEAMPELLAALQQGAGPERICRGRFVPYATAPRRSDLIDYARYAAEGAIVGFETHRGCSSSCVYCIEAATPVAFRSPADVIADISGFVARGFDRFHLCDPEFNEDLDHALDFCEALDRASLTIHWTVYMKPANFNQRLFRLMKKTGVSLITLTVDSFRKCPLYWSDMEKMIFNARNAGIRIAVDFLTGFPYEDEDLIRWCIDLFRRLGPDLVNINTYIRLYETLAVTKIIRQDRKLARFLSSSVNGGLVRPVFYHQVDEEHLRGLIGGDPLFRIEGTDRGVNYTRAGSLSDV